MNAASLVIVALSTSLLVTGSRSAARLELATRQALQLRGALLSNPAAARRAACAPTRDMACSPTLLVRLGPMPDTWASACGLTPRQPEPPRYYRVRVDCAVWPSFPRRRLLDLVIFR